MQTLQTSDGVSTPEVERHPGQTRRRRLSQVIATASPYWLAAAGMTATVAFASTVHGRVPFGSGVAVALLTVAALVDVSERRLPDAIVGAAAMAFAVCIGLETATGKTEVSVVELTAGVAAFGGPLFVVHLVTPSAMGFGDVKAGIVLGAALGVVDWQLALAGLAVAAGLTATVGVLTQASTIAFGPGLVAASAIALAAHPMLLADTDRAMTTRPIAVVAAADQEPEGAPHD